MKNYNSENFSETKPREKLMTRGAKSLSDKELLSIILQTGIKGKDVYSLAAEIDSIIKNNDEEVSYKSLRKITGIGEVKALKIIACLEYSKRYKTLRSKKIESASDIYKLSHTITEKKQEYFLLFTIDGAGCLIRKRNIFVGTINRSIVHPREVFAYAIKDRASSVIFVHNHPSGNLNPSQEDIMVTKKLKEIGDLMDISVLDHVIVSSNDYFSFSINNMI